MDVLKVMSQQIELVDEKLSPEHKKWKQDCINASVAVSELIEAAEQMRIDLNITRSNIMAEMTKGRDRWDGVPEILEHRISVFDAALSRVRGAE